ncbi:MAG: hypothetical protein AB1486_11270 [Planctomycetota bacterium]
MARQWFLVVAAWLVMAPALLAGQTWIVAEDGSGDFLEIQQAIDAASERDLILVKRGTYDSFTLRKALTIVGSGEDQTIAGQVWIREVPAGIPVVASMRALHQKPVLGVLSPEARIVLWRISLEIPPNVESYGSGFNYCRAAFLNNVTQIYDPDNWCDNQWNDASCLGLDHGQHFFISQSHFHAWDLINLGTVTGAAGILLNYEARGWIAETDAIGGAGGMGYLGYDCVESHKGGPGGPGIWLADDHLPWTPPPEATIFGRPVNVIQGGPGGPGVEYIPGCDIGEGGTGGSGIVASAGVATYSGVVPQGGPGGDGHPPGDPGGPGNGIETFPAMPTSTMEGDGKPGTTATFSFHATPGDQLQLVYSTVPDVFELPRTEGHPLIPSPEGVFGLIPGGVIDDTGTKAISFVIPTDVPPGIPFYVQGVLLGAHAPQLTNMSMLVTTPVWN